MHRDEDVSRSVSVTKEEMAVVGDALTPAIHIFHLNSQSEEKKRKENITPFGVNLMRMPKSKLSTAVQTPGCFCQEVLDVR